MTTKANIELIHLQEPYSTEIPGPVSPREFATQSVLH
jgi:hypothetical protein